MADNDLRVVQKLKRIYRESSYKLNYIGKPILDASAGTEYISNLINTDEPFMLCRLGAEESRTVYKWIKHKPYEERNIHNIKFNAGVFPNDVGSIDKFCSVYSDSVKCANGIFTWGCVGEAALIKKYAPRDVKLLELRTNFVLFLDEPWTISLEGKKVLIVHPFAETMRNQYEVRDKLFGKKCLPTFASLEFIRAVQSSAGESEYIDFPSWFDALQYMEDEIEKKDFDIALIGAGAYGIPLAAHIKSMGKQAIHMASDLQVLFGIRGKRWDNWPEWASHFNQYWVYPSDEETPKRRNIVEGGSYWK